MTSNLIGNSIYLICSTTILCCAAVILLVLLVIGVRGKHEFRKLVETLSYKANVALQELSAIFIPTHFITDNDVHGIISKYDGLVSEISALTQHKYYNLDTFQNSKAGQLMHFIEGIKGYQDDKNTIYNAIEDLKATAAFVMAQYREYTNPKHDN